MKLKVNVYKTVVRPACCMVQKRGRQQGDKKHD